MKRFGFQQQMKSKRIRRFSAARNAKHDHSFSKERIVSASAVPILARLCAELNR